ncbi:MAG: alanine--tRNA ligase [Planctomycetota bacterium]|nr:alanine--tRNA ligase [Planctomycetota bacterium]
MSRTAVQIRQEFIDYFATRHGHMFVPSSRVVPMDDPTLLFTNAGMNQFKDVFLAQGKRNYLRAVNSQKCIRAGGKHNDLEDVGRDTYHHTFFEMLGNWSFGDYFKAEAIEWAWDLLTNVWGLDKDRLYASVFEGDPTDGTEPDLEAENLWREKTNIDPSHISRWDKKDNFWEMGETGPCGPCSEIHYDSRSLAERVEVDGSTLVNKDHPDVIEIWNLVFIQFNRDDQGNLTPLPDKHVDTGMGFERLVRVLQNKQSNYDTDLWFPIFMAIEAHTNAHPYQGSLTDPVDVAYRIIADHVRCLTVALSDGARPGNEGRSYVLRRILRRALRVAHQTLKIEGPILNLIVPAVVESLGDVFPNLRDDPEKIADIILNEEEAFLKTIDRGLALFTDTAHRVELANSKVIPADDAFKLHDTYGFPIDLTQIMAEERGMTVDLEGYERRMDQARLVSRQTTKVVDGEKVTSLILSPEAIAKLKHNGIEPTRDIDKYHGRPVGAKLVAIWNGEDFDNTAYVGRRVGIITSKTNFYAEQGGQVGDTGLILTDVKPSALPMRGYQRATPGGGCTFRVDETHVNGDYVIHIGSATDDELRVLDRVQMQVDKDCRKSIMSNHTSTHLLNLALREVLGDEVNQKGSLVAADRLRFDFSHSGAMTPPEVKAVEKIVNEQITKAQKVYAETAPLEMAKAINGVRAVFGEVYPDPVRVVSIGVPLIELMSDPGNEKWINHSIEFCGGTHLENTDGADQFVITHESALAAGVRRIIALTGDAAHQAREEAMDLESNLIRISEMVDYVLPQAVNLVGKQFENAHVGYSCRHRLQTLIDDLRDRVKGLRKQEQASNREQVVEQARELAEHEEGPVIVHQVFEADKDTLLAAMDVLRAKRPDAATMLFSASEVESKVVIVAGVPKELIAKGLKAGDWVKTAAQVCGGGGGGKPDMAQAGGKDPEKVGEAMTKAREFARKVIA